MNPKLGIVILHVRDLAQARHFYETVVGLQIDPAQTDEHFVSYHDGGDGLLSLEAAPDAGANTGTTELGFAVNDVDGVYQDWKQKGVRLVSEPADFPFGRAFDAQDPEGNSLSIYKFRGTN